MRPQTSDERCYFFLSYAHSAPLGDGATRRDPDTDVWVRRCFDDLSREVGILLRRGPEGVGFVDYLAEAGADWKAVQTEMLGRAEVFVPLCSPGYFNKSWPMRERASFEQRLETIYPNQPDRRRTHIVPVLWLPMPAAELAAERDAAVDLAPTVSEYVENGLRALGMLASYRGQYEDIVRRLAKRIVAATGSAPLLPTRAVAIDDIPMPEPMTSTTPFIVGVAASASGYRPGPTIVTPGTAWRPYGTALDLPISEYVANVAERLGLPTRVIDRPLDLKALDTAPGVVLVDPWILHRDGGDETLVSISEHLHPWATPVVVTDRLGAPYQKGGADLTARAAARLAELGAHRVYRALDVDQLARLMPAAVSDARRQYLRWAPLYAPVSSTRPRLAGDDPTEQNEKERR